MEKVVIELTVDLKNKGKVIMDLLKFGASESLTLVEVFNWIEKNNKGWSFGWTSSIKEDALSDDLKPEDVTQEFDVKLRAKIYF